MIFDTPAYCLSLPHLGQPFPVASLVSPLLLRPIPGTDHNDAIGPWPYASAPSPARLAGVLEELRTTSLVTATLFVRPDATAGWLGNEEGPPLPGVEAVRLKDHYVLDPALPRPGRRPKTRRNLAIAARHWRISPVPHTQLAELGAQFQNQLAARRHISPIADVPAGHFAVLAGLNGIETMAAVDEDGIGALLIAARAHGETHLLHLFTAPRVVRTCGTYLLMATALDQWSRDGCVYLGGAPSSADGPGIAKFKARWANRTAAAMLLKVILNTSLYQHLTDARPATSFFPAYRGHDA